MERLRQDYKECYVCGNPNVDRHHLIGGTSNRTNSEKHGLWIYLCREHHREAHDDPYTNRMYKRLGQIVYEQEHSREDFIKTFGKSFIMEDIEI